MLFSWQQLAGIRKATGYTVLIKKSQSNAMKWPWSRKNASSAGSGQASTAALSEEQLEFWRRNGYLVLPRFCTDAQLRAVNETVERAWNESWPRVVVDDTLDSERLRLCEVTPERRASRSFKTNDLYLEDARVREIALNPRITPILTALLGHVPVLCNSLNFEKGSQQGDHIDALFMTPQSRGHLIAIWVALEDCAADAGPLRYYPGSHLIEPYTFSTGSHHVVPEEMPQWMHYTMGTVDARGLQAQTFAAKKGDVFIWHAYLLHGGSQIQNPDATRKSVVFHYYSEHDCRAMGCTLVPESGAYWLHRSHPEIPGRGPSDAPPLPPGFTLAQGRG